MDKEQCLKALKNYKELFQLYRIDYYLTEAMDKEIINNIECIENLIEEHFDNPPLTINDSKVGELYWDNEDKEWCFFTSLHDNIFTGVKISVSLPPTICPFNFKKKSFL